MGEKFNLKWKDFQTNVSKSFGLFRNADHLHDVTLVSDDFKQVSAHKLVLSASSEYFQRLFKETKQSQPLIVLEGMESSDLINVLHYVYEGEVRIHQDDLDRFLTIAQRLMLEGLLSNNDDFMDQNEEDVHSKVDKIYSQEPKIEKMEQKEIPLNPRKKQYSVSHGTIAFNAKSQEIENYEEIREKITENIITNEDGSLTCKICNKTRGGSKNDARTVMRRHMQTHIEGVSYPCSFCDKTFRSKNSFNNHKSVYHRL